MDADNIITQIRSQLEQIAIREEKNQQEQAATHQRIEKLEAKIQQQYRRQSELDQEAIELYRQAEELKTKLKKLEQIAALSQKFQTLAADFQDNQELLDTLYSSMTTPITDEVGSTAPSKISHPQPQVQAKQTAKSDPYQGHAQTPPFDSSVPGESTSAQADKDIEITIDKIKAALPDAERLYQKLVARYLEQYQTFQNFIVDELDLIWCSVAFIAFGRASYRSLSRKHHPDLEGSDHAMQLINTAWEISQDYTDNSN